MVSRIFRAVAGLAVLVSGVATAQPVGPGIYGGGEFRDIAVSTDGTWFVTASTRGEADIRDTATLERKFVLGPHDEPVLGIGIVENDTAVITVDAWFVRKWDVTTGQLIAVLANIPLMRCMEMSPDRTFLLVGNALGMVKRVEVATGDVSDVYATTPPIAITDISFSMASGLFAINLSNYLTVLLQPAFSTPISITYLYGGKSSVIDAQDKLLIGDVFGGIYPRDAQVPVQWQSGPIEMMRNLRGSGVIAATTTNRDIGLISNFAPYDSHGYFPDGGFSIAELPAPMEALAGANGVINRLDLSRPVETWRFEPIVQRIHPIAFGADSNLFAYHDGSRIVIRNTETHEILLSMQEDAELNSIRLSTSGSALVAADSASRVRIWDVVAGTVRATLTASESRAALKAVPTQDAVQVFVLYADGTARQWDVASNQVLRTIEDPIGYITDVDYSRDSSKLLTVHTDGNVRVWSAAGGDPLFTFTGSGSSVGVAAFMPDGRQVISASVDGAARLWNVDDGSVVQSFPGHTFSINSMSISADGSRFATASNWGDVCLWDIGTGDELDHIQGAFRSAVALSEDGKLELISTDLPSIFLVDQAAQPLLQSMQEGHKGNVDSIAYSADGSRMASAGGNRVMVWGEDRARPMNEIELGNTVTELKMSPDGAYVYVGGLGYLEKRYALTGAVIKTFVGVGGVVTSLALSADGKLLASATDSFAELWDANSAQRLRVFPGQASCVDINGDGSVVVTGESNNFGVTIWLSATGAARRTLPHASFVRSLRLLPNGEQLLTLDSNGIKIWDLKDDGVRVLDPGAHVTAMAVSDDGGLAAFVFTSVGIGVMSIDGSEQQTRPTPLVSEAIAFLPGGKLIAAGQTDGTIHVWPSLTAPPIECVSPLTVGLSQGMIAAESLYAFPDLGGLDFSVRKGDGPAGASYLLTCEDVEDSPVTLTLTAGVGGGATTCEASVTVIDDVPPMARALDAFLFLDAAGNATLLPAMINDGSEECAGAVFSVAPSQFSCDDIGAQNVQLTVSDGNNSDTASAIVTILDITPPVILLTGGDLVLNVALPLSSRDSKSPVHAARGWPRQWK